MARGPLPMDMNPSLYTCSIRKVDPPSTDISNSTGSTTTVRGRAATRPPYERMEAATAAMLDDFMMTVRDQRVVDGRIEYARSVTLEGGEEKAKVPDLRNVCVCKVWRGGRGRTGRLCGTSWTEQLTSPLGSAWPLL